MIPLSTSPIPPLAMPGLPVRLIQVILPSDINVPAPLSTHIPPYCKAIFFTAEKRSASTSAVEQASKAAASPGWGVNIH